MEELKHLNIVKKWMHTGFRRFSKVDQIDNKKGQ